MQHPRKEKIWALPTPSLTEAADVACLSRELGVSQTLARLLCRRGYRTPEAATAFFNCTDAVLHRPLLMKDMDRAVARMRQAVDGGERIVIYGDYDVDGVTAVSLLYLYFTSLGADVSYYIPSRTGEGYGISVGAIDRFAAEGVTCMITVDTGITANDEVLYARDHGIDVVITDHHECRLPLPPAVAVVDPHRPDCTYPFRDLAGVGVAFKFVSAYESALAVERGEQEIDGVRAVCLRYADLMAIGTIADVMPIVDENRVMVKYGMQAVENTERAGLRALIDLVNAAKGGEAPRRKITTGFIGYALAPRLNAAGRMRDATTAVELLLADNEARAMRLAEELCEINRERQQEENSIAEEAFRRIEEEIDLESTRVLVLESDHWRQGIIGIVSSRITERYGLPSILVSFDGNATGSPYDEGKGSGRSTGGVNLVEALGACEDLLVKFGGHEQAAGLTVRRDRLEEFRRRINEYVDSILPRDRAKVSLSADMELQLSDVTLPLAEELVKLEPFGTANPVPRFVLRELVVEHIADLGGGKHLKLTVGKEGRSVYALLFSTTRSEIDFFEGDTVDVLATLDINEFRGRRSVQLTAQDIRRSACYRDALELEKQRYLEIKGGAAFGVGEGILPDRTLCVHAYTAIRREYRRGKDTFTEEELLALLNMEAPCHIHYACMKYILHIFNELQICGIEEPSAEVYRFTVGYRTEKTDIERSLILKKLRTQCRSEEGGER